MTETTIFVGLDVHKKTIAVVTVEGRASADVRFHGTIANTPEVKKFGFDRTGINEVVGVFADCETSQLAAQKSEAHNEHGAESHQGEGRPAGTGQAARQRLPGLQDHGVRRH